MTLTFIGLGLCDAKDVTIRGLQAIQMSHVVYLEHYTAILANDITELQYFFGKQIIVADRNLVESKAEETILRDAETKNVAFLVVGDVFSATTHTDLFLRAKKKGIIVDVINNASILTAVGITGLQLYKFGKTTSMVFFDDKWKPQTAYDVVKQNKSLGLHTLILLDIKVAELSKDDMKFEKSEKAAVATTPQPPRFMTVKQGVEQLLEIESLRKENVIAPQTLMVGVARLGSDKAAIKVGTASDLIAFDFGAPMHSLIIPGDLHFLEEEVLALYK